MIRTVLTDEEQGEVWRRYRTGESMRSISRALRPSLDQIRRVNHATGGRMPKGEGQDEEREGSGPT